MDPFAPVPHCPVCGGAMQPPVRTCPACRTEHHAECWKYIGGCAIYACAERAVPPPLHAVGVVEHLRHRPPMHVPWGSLVVVGVLVAVLAGLVLPTLADARKRSKVTDCKSNMKQLGIYLNTYVSRYGGDTFYPTCIPPQAPVGAARSLGSNGAFWSHLWLLPNPGVAVARRLEDDGLFKCKVYGGSLTRTCLDYSGPNLANIACFPGGRLSDRVLPNVYISGDLLIPGQCNHGNDATGPNYDYNGLRFDGSVQNIPPSAYPGSEQFNYVQQTDAVTGTRTP